MLIPGLGGTVVLDAMRAPFTITTNRMCDWFTPPGK